MTHEGSVTYGSVLHLCLTRDSPRTTSSNLETRTALDVLYSDDEKFSCLGVTTSIRLEVFSIL